MVDQLSSFADEVTRVARDVGVEGQLGGQAEVRGVSGIWKELTDNVNMMASNLTNQVRDIAQVTTAVATGDLSKKITVEVRGEILELKNTINTMVDQLRSFANEVTRVAREVGTEGILGGQAQVSGVSGTWRELTDNVNIMARNLTEQVRGIARVVTAVANGDLKQELHLDTRGEIATLVQTINSMLVTLSTFADQVSGVARDVGVEGKLGGQADVPGAAGIWRDLTNNVNELAGNLTRQVRAIGDVATAVTKGDLTQTINVEAQGEVAVLKDNINQMIRTLAETTRVNQDQDWLKTNLTRFTRMLQGQRDLLTVAEQVLTELAPVVGAQHGAFYMSRHADGDAYLELFATYACAAGGHVPTRYAVGESLVGQAAHERKRILVRDVPAGYVRVGSALGDAAPTNLVLAPLLFEGEVKGVVELASFHSFTDIQLAFLEQLIDSLGIVVATIEATMRTDDLLRQSQSMAEELQKQQEELQQTNEELEEKARQLTAQKEEVEHKNREVELAKQELEEKAEQLALTSKYKSEFLANMSHELRTPLNSLLILSRQLADNLRGNLEDEQVEYARTIHDAGADLLALINEILDLAKIESGTMAIEVSEVAFIDLHEYVDRSFAQLAKEKGLSFRVELAEDLPATIATDGRRLRQVLRNLISNALKFTDSGTVTVRVEAAARWSATDSLGSPDGAIAFSVSDTGIGIPVESQQIIFEAFQQSDGGTSRRYGGTGLGLSISREIAWLLGGALTVDSSQGVGSRFTLYLPARYESRAKPAPRRSDQPQPQPPRREREQPSRVSVPVDVADDRMAIGPDDDVLLVVESDEPRARALLERGRARSQRGVVALGGQDAIETLKTLQPHSIVISSQLADMDGWVLLDWLKHDPEFQHIPVVVVATERDVVRGLEAGAVALLTTRAGNLAVDEVLERAEAAGAGALRRVLVVASEPARAAALSGALDLGSVSMRSVTDEGEVARVLERERFGAVVLSALHGAREMSWLADPSLDAAFATTPIVVRADAALSPDDRKALERLRGSRVVRVARGPDELVHAVVLYVHIALDDLPVASSRALREQLHADPILRGRNALIVDDDVRNIFAITAVLERQGMRVVSAENGQEALGRLAEHDAIDVVLMDIMMPEMDGYEATRRIRASKRWSDLPIIALTAKAMKGDREKCIEAGATDYVTKPVEPEQLLSAIRVHLPTLEELLGVRVERPEARESASTATR